MVYSSANSVGRDLGNGDELSQDGSRFRGRGLMQLTGRDWFSKFSKETRKYGENIDFTSDAGAALIGSKENPKYAVWSACWEFGTSAGIISNAKNNDFFKVSQLVNGTKGNKPPVNWETRVKYYNRALTQFKTGLVYNAGDRPANSNSKNTSESLEQNKDLDESLNLLNVNFDFSKIADNISNAELENTDVTWGNRSTANEESDFIGLKQFLIYLTTRFYPQALVPFVEIVPVFNVASLDKINSVSTANQMIAVEETAKKLNISPQTLLDAKESIIKDDNIIQGERYNRTTEKLLTLLNEGGTDLTLTDPFEEFSSLFNTPNQAGLDLAKIRGFGYKIYGATILNPAASPGGTSKPGAIGLTGFEIEMGSQQHQGMSFITLKLRDVQGNKFLDPNSPWNFILNARPGVNGGDFLLRFGWQLRIPEYTESYKGDPMQYKFWNHPGWNIFSALGGEANEGGDRGTAIKQYISTLASRGDWTLTFTSTSTVNKDVMSFVGYETITDSLGKKSQIRSRKLKENMNFMPLTLLNPELNINNDGSIDATLYFRTNSAVANCLIPLYGGGISDYKTKSLMAKEIITLEDLMKAFIDDNFEYTKIDTTEVKTDTVIFSHLPIRDWLTVIGGIGEDSSYLDINPSDIKLSISSDLKDKITNVTSRDTGLLIGWVSQVLQENDMALLSSADYGQRAGGQGFVIALDSEKKSSQNGTIIKGEDLAKNDATFGDYLNYVNYNESSNNFIGKRLLLQDDVFSFRHQGSLVEDITIEKLSAPNAATIAAKKNFANSQGESDVNSDKTDVTAKSDKALTPDVTLEDKKRNLNTILTEMLGVRITAICHPWLKLARPIYVKGMGFWDGKYTVTKITHTLGEDSKFITKINGNRILPNNYNNNYKLKSKLKTEIALNNPGAKYADKNVNPSNGYAPSGNVKSYGPNIAVPNPQQIITESNFKGIVNNVVPKLRPSLENYLTLLHPDYQNIFRAFILDFETTKPQYKIVINSTYRSFAEQDILKKTITGHNPDGTARYDNASPGKSLHNYGLAIDINIANANGDIFLFKSSPKSQWEATGILDIAKIWRLKWGGTFNGYPDNVHFQIQGFDNDILLMRAHAQFGNDTGKIQGNRLNLTGSDDLKKNPDVDLNYNISTAFDFRNK